MPDEDKNVGGSIVLDLRKWWRHMQAKNLRTDSERKLLIGQFNLTHVK